MTSTVGALRGSERYIRISQHHDIVDNISTRHNHIVKSPTTDMNLCELCLRHRLSLSPSNERPGLAINFPLDGSKQWNSNKSKQPSMSSQCHHIAIASHYGRFNQMPGHLLAKDRVFMAIKCVGSLTLLFVLLVSSESSVSVIVTGRCMRALCKPHCVHECRENVS